LTALFRRKRTCTVARANYKLICLKCHHFFDDDGFVLQCPRPHSPALLRTVYAARKLEYDDTAEGIYRYGCWLPTVHRLAKPGRLATFHSKRLGAILRLPNLWIVFSGYWPEIGATLETGTFKELEAYGVLSRISIPCVSVLVIASAGNTAAAFARTCSPSSLLSSRAIRPLSSAVNARRHPQRALCPWTSYEPTAH